MPTVPAFERMPTDAQLLRGRRALVTGADSGIGQGIAYALAAHGASVAIDHVGPPDIAEAMAAAIAEGGGTAFALAMNVADEEAVERGFAQARARMGGLDLLVNNAGVERKYALVDMPLNEWQRVLDINLTGVFLCSREAARIMAAEPADAACAIVNISSVHELIPWEGFSHYCATKGAVKLFAQSIARELAPLGIRVLNVAPGAIATPINADVLADPRSRAAVEEEIPLGRWGTVEDVAAAVAWAASEQAGYVVGSTLFVDGGMTLYPRFV
ncbi:MAG TPA: glucose 1-dehydrogenase [Conexibacter sp.]|nr:glucose 1-dehydrogenase [Conexibacter sp.]